MLLEDRLRLDDEARLFELDCDLLTDALLDERFEDLFTVDEDLLIVGADLFMEEDLLFVVILLIPLIVEDSEGLLVILLRTRTVFDERLTLTGLLEIFETALFTVLLLSGLAEGVLVFGE